MDMNMDNIKKRTKIIIEVCDVEKIQKNINTLQYIIDGNCPRPADLVSLIDTLSILQAIKKGQYEIS
jgi:hypothetical protein